jgi:hypothetical protein
VTSRRLRSITHNVRLPAGERHHDLTITLAFDSEGRAVEIAFVGRGTIGSGMDQMLVDLGIAISRLLQFRDPATGEGLE